jgi:hypothetical protein
VPAILEKRKRGARPPELLDHWPTDLEWPATATVYQWLTGAFEQKLDPREILGEGRRWLPPP